MSKKYQNYALLLFASKEVALAAISSESLYNQIHSELSAKYFGGDTEFNLSPVSKRQVGNEGFSSMGPSSEAMHD